MTEESEALSWETFFEGWSRVPLPSISARGVRQPRLRSNSPFPLGLVASVTHVIRGARDINDRTTIVSVDGIGAFVQFPGTACFRARVVDGDQMIPFVRLFYGSLSVHM